MFLKAIKVTGGVGRDRFLNKFVIPYVTLVSDDNRPLTAYKHFEISSCINRLVALRNLCSGCLFVCSFLWVKGYVNKFPVRKFYR